MLRLFFRTWKDLRLILFVPDTILIILNVLLGNLILMQTGIGNALSGLRSLPLRLESLPLIESFISANFISLIFFGLFFVIVNFVVGSGLLSIKYGLMKGIVNEKTLKFYEYSKEYFWKVVKLKFLVFLVMTLLVIVFGALATLFYFLFADKIAYVLLILLMVLVLILLKLALLFRYPSLFLKDKSAFMAVRNSLLFFRKKFFTVVASLLVVVLVGVFLSFGYIGITSLFNYVGRAYYYYFIIFFIVWQLLGIIINLVNNVWSDLFLFYVFKEKQ